MQASVPIRRGWQQRSKHDGAPHLPRAMLRLRAADNVHWASMQGAVPAAEEAWEAAAAGSGQGTAPAASSGRVARPVSTPIISMPSSAAPHTAAMSALPAPLSRPSMLQVRRRLFCLSDCKCVELGCLMFPPAKRNCPALRQTLMSSRVRSASPDNLEHRNHSLYT